MQYKRETWEECYDTKYKSTQTQLIIYSPTWRWTFLEDVVTLKDERRANKERLSEERLESPPEVDRALYKHTIIIIIII